MVSILATWCVHWGFSFLPYTLFSPAFLSIFLLAVSAVETCVHGKRCSEGEVQRYQCSEGFQGPHCQYGELPTRPFYYDLELSALLLGASQFCRSKLMAGLSLWGLVSIWNQPLSKNLQPTVYSAFKIMLCSLVLIIHYKSSKGSSKYKIVYFVKEMAA